jgi:hypothetical protein
MDDSFAFRTTIPLRRRVDRRLVHAGIWLAIVLTVIGWFSGWVVASERRSFATRSVPRAEPTAIAAPPAVDPNATIEDARDALRVALVAARAAYTQRRSFLDADPAGLSALQPGYTFVDGPSTTTRIVSVASDPEAWAAAVLAPDGTCLWIRVSGWGAPTRAVGEECTGAAALGSGAGPATRG